MQIMTKKSFLNDSSVVTFFITQMYTKNLKDYPKHDLRH